MWTCESIRLLTKNERCEGSWANRSPKMSKWVNRSFFWVNGSIAHFWAKNERFTWKTDERIPSPGRLPKKKNKDIREDKEVAVGWGTYFRTNQLKARMIWTKVFGRTSILVGQWSGMMWTVWSSIYDFSKAFIASSSCFLFIGFLISSYWKISNAARNWINFVSQTAATTFCLLFCLCPSSIV